MPSSVIRRFSYDAEREELTITFVTGRVYRYSSVPEAVYREFTGAFSKGTYFNTKIRDAYRYEELLADSAS
jgi:hypothetical protein